MWSCVVGMELAGCGDSPTRLPDTGADREPLVQLPAPPQSLGDGWSVATLDDAELDAGSMRRLTDGLARGHFGPVRSLLVARDGALAYEYYADGWGRDALHPMHSVTKSVAGLLVGIAIGDGLLTRDAALPDLLPGRRDLIATDPGKADLRLGHLLDMRAGLAWDEWSCTYAEPCNDARQMDLAADWNGFVLSRPVVEPPGSHFVYSTGVSVLLGEILREATGEDPGRYAADRLFRPLGVEATAWLRQRGDGLPHLGGGLSLRARDLLKLGQLVADGGRWGGAPVVSEAWIRHIVDEPEGATLRDAYRAQWWMRPLRGRSGHAPGDSDIVHASGFGGQHVFVVRPLGLVVATTSGNEDGSSRGFEILAEVLHAVRR